MDLVDVLLWMLVGATVWPAWQSVLHTRGVTVMALGVVTAVSVALVGCAAWSLPAWQGIAREDGPVEWATFAAFVAAAVWNAAVVRRESKARITRLLCWGLALFCIAVAGEEISWGQRLFAFQPPEAFLEHNVQQELNLHNVLMDSRTVGFELDSKYLVAAVALVFGAVFPLVHRRLRSRLLDGVAPPAALVPVFLAVVATELTYPIELAGEGAELMLGLLFMASAVCAAPPKRPMVAGALIMLPLVLGAVISPVLGQLVFGADAENTAKAHAELEALRLDVENGIKPRLRDKNGAVHKRVFTAVRDGYLDVSGGTFLEGKSTPASPSSVPDAVRRDRTGYFLDPWNNPYWLFWDKKSKFKAAIYSFGPNRQRDTDLRRDKAPAGDDILVRVPIAQRVSPASDGAD